MPGPVQEIELEAKPGRWRLRRADPSPDLATLVREYWEVEGALDPFRETILPNGWLELMVNLGPPHRVLSERGSGIWQRAWLSGLHEHAIRLESNQGTHLVSARLHPVGAVELLGADAPRVANSIIDLEAFLGSDGARLQQAIHGAGTASGRFATLEAFLRNRRVPGNALPDFVRDAATRIERAHGNLRVSLLHANTNVSRKHLAVTFTRGLGISPRGYAKIHRFAWTIDRLRDRRSVDWSKLATEAGYSDQSHLIRDFRRVGGATATAYLPRLTPDGIALWDD